MNLDNGTKLFYLYFVIFLLFSGIGYEIFGQENVTYFKIEWNHLKLFLFLLFFIFSIFISNHKNYNIYVFKKFVSIDLQLVLLLFADLIIILNINNAGIRYSYYGISEMNAGILVYSYLLMNTFLNFLLMIYIFYKPDYLFSYGWKSKLLFILYLTGILFSINGNATTLLALIFISFYFFPKIFSKLLFKDKEFSLKDFTLKLIIIILTIPALVIANLYGESIKNGVDFKTMVFYFDVLEYSDRIFKYIFTYVLPPNYISFKYSLNNFSLSFDLDMYLNHVRIPFDNFYFRLNKITGFNDSVTKPIISSYSRLNYIYITEFPREREGTSPGFFASFFLTFPFPINYISLIFIIKYLSKRFNILILSMRNEISIFGLIFYLYFFIQPLFSSPFDFFILFDNMTFYYILFILFAKYCIKKIN